MTIPARAQEAMTATLVVVESCPSHAMNGPCTASRIPQAIWRFGCVSQFRQVGNLAAELLDVPMGPQQGSSCWAPRTVRHETMALEATMSSAATTGCNMPAAASAMPNAL